MALHWLPAADADDHELGPDCPCKPHIEIEYSADGRSRRQVWKHRPLPKRADDDERQEA